GYLLASVPYSTMNQRAAKRADSITKSQRRKLAGSRPIVAETAHATRPASRSRPRPDADPHDPRRDDPPRPWRPPPHSPDRDRRGATPRGTVPGPRVITSLDGIPPADGDADGLRRTVQQRVAAGADVIKIRGWKSIREGGGPTLSEDKLRAACGEAKAHGRRCVVHAHAAEAARRAVLAGATSIEHGVLLDEATLDLMADHGTFFDPNLYLVFQNYFDNKARFLGMENYTEEGFAQMH